MLLPSKTSKLYYSADQSSLDALASAARVVLSTAGPFLKIGTPLVDAAVRNGSHYVDITGG